MDPSCNRRGFVHPARRAQWGLVRRTSGDHVLPEVPMRQVVVSWPREMNGRLAFVGDLVRAAQRIAADELQVCGSAAVAAGVRERVGPARADVDGQDVEQPGHGLVATVDGLNLDVGPRMDGRTARWWRKVCRCVLRVALALSRPKKRKDGLLACRLKRPDQRGNTVLVLSLEQRRMRLCSLIPAPGTPMRTSLGVVAAGARWRRRVVPNPTHTRGTKHGDKPAPKQSLGEVGGAVEAVVGPGRAGVPPVQGAHDGHGGGGGPRRGGAPPGAHG
jgi:hypothetical protein